MVDTGVGQPGVPPEALRGSRVLATIRAMLPSLVPSEARVAEALLARPEAILDCSVAELAGAAQVSPAAVVRASQSLGYTGFDELRRRLTRDLREPAGPVPPTGDAPSVVRAVLAVGIRQTENTLAMLDPVAVTEAVGAMAAARRLLIAATGALGSIASYTALRMAMSGRAAESSIDQVAVHAAAVSLQPQDVCLVFGLTGTSSLTVRTAAIAAERGATVIAVTGFARAPLAERADIHLVTGVPDPATLPVPYARTYVGHQLLADGLAAAVGVELGSEGERAREEIFDVIVDGFLRRRAGD